MHVGCVEMVAIGHVERLASDMLVRRVRWKLMDSLVCWKSIDGFLTVVVNLKYHTKNIESFYPTLSGEINTRL